MQKIPENDMKVINDSFKFTDAVETLGKNSFGQVVEAKRKIVNESVITFMDFSGRILKHQKSIVYLGRGQDVIGIKGQKYDDIPIESRKLVVWLESDFE